MRCLAAIELLNNVKSKGIMVKGSLLDLLSNQGLLLIFVGFSRRYAAAAELYCGGLQHTDMDLLAPWPNRLPGAPRQAFETGDTLKTP